MSAGVGPYVVYRPEFERYPFEFFLNLKVFSMEAHSRPVCEGFFLNIDLQLYFPHA